MADKETANMLQTNGHYRSDEEVREVVRRFEACAFTPAEFKHAPHLTVALLYLLESPWQEALERMRQSIRRFLAHHRLDASVYHETMTVFWIKRVRSFVEKVDGERPLFLLANELLAECGDARLVFGYYSKELIESDESRKGWAEPDLKPLDF
ncbi:MAG TPA: hypothetical protein VM934_00525 [Pyrinomonadaceae bacterium]|jgi:hypothetical protein|nr:hypothetical protein [Pyrinomonadaceae bacterium]